MAIEAASPRMPYSCDPTRSRGRLHLEPLSVGRNAFRRDCDRIIHATAFRRLRHKTQVFVFHEGDHYRTRLTHTLEVTQIARALARTLGLDEDLAEALALSHDLGHPPFGHAGERALDACLKAYGGFDHNIQTLRVVAELEQRYPEFDGLNLTIETLEGIIKHNGPFREPEQPSKGPRLPARIAKAGGIDLALHAPMEAQVAAIADDIAYDAHDIDDGLRAGLFTLDALTDIPLLAKILTAIRDRYPALDAERTVHELIRRLIGAMIEDVGRETAARVTALSPATPDDVRRAGRTMVAFSEPMRATDAAIKGFLYPRMYRQERIARIMRDAEAVVADLHAHFVRQPETLPADWLSAAGRADEASRARRAGDFIAGMTDRYALVEHARYFDSTPELR
ncbi:MAG TPA: deoxyguanosinetriphosphate triphosphohydrolase [Xanthobacteraceae bacterium]|jgi:dGTPase|nr:deoxyguanosinetriphosphate triphosphohydrolase [Xanthobacteraceae bacterium]